MTDKETQRVAVVVGGSRGIGYALVEHLAAEGYLVVVVAKNVERLKTIKAMGHVTLRADVSKRADCRVVQRNIVSIYDSIDVLINAAAELGPLGPIASRNLVAWARTIEVNLLGTVNLTCELLPLLQKGRHPSIINFAGGGVGGGAVQRNASAYVTSKAAIVQFTEALAKETEVRINCISPGVVRTAMSESLGTVPEDHDQNEALRKVTTLVSWLASPSCNVSGRFLSAKWDRIEDIERAAIDMHTMRRIDGTMFECKH